MSSLGLNRSQLYCKTSSVASYQELGLSGIDPSTDTTLTGGNSYQIKVNGVNYTIVMPSGTVTFDDMVKAINENTSIIAAKIRALFIDEDVRIYIEAASIVLAAGTADDLLAALTSTPDAAVDAVMYFKHVVNDKIAMINCISLRLPITYTGDIVWEIIKPTTIDQGHNQRFAEAVAAKIVFYKESLVTPCKFGDTIIISTNAACAGTSYITLAISSNGW